MGKGLVNKLKEEFDIKEEWINFEIHPETPKEGVLLAKKFCDANISRMVDSLNHSGAKYGIKFENMAVLSNSRMAIEASEYARDKGKFFDFHDKLFHAYFSEGKDIGNKNVLLKIAEEVGLDKAGLETALEEGKYTSVLNNASEEAERLGISGTPTFIINDFYRIIGAQPIEIFRRTLKEIENDKR